LGRRWPGRLRTRMKLPGEEDSFGVILILAI
jgi:hypothetical protein